MPPSGAQRARSPQALATLERGDAIDAIEGRQGRQVTGAPHEAARASQVIQPMEARICPGLGQACYPRYCWGMSPHPAVGAPPGFWKPHPDDEAEIGAAMKAATQLELLSPEASEAFLRWMEATLRPVGRAWVRRVKGRNLWLWYRFDDAEVMLIAVTTEPPVPLDDDSKVE